MRLLTALAFVLFAFTALTGCVVETSEEHTCCLNEQFYDCPDQEALDQCTLDDGPGECQRDSTRDDEC